MTLAARERVARWIADLDAILATAEEIVSRGEGPFSSDPAIPLAFEALSNRVGELCKRLIGADPARFNAPIWAQAARNRDFVVHHYDWIDSKALWVTVSVSFPELHRILRKIQAAEALHQHDRGAQPISASSASSTDSSSTRSRR